MKEYACGEYILRVYQSMQEVESQHIHGQFYYFGKKYYATSHRSAVVFYLSFVQMHVLLNRSSLVVVIFVGI